MICPAGEPIKITLNVPSIPDGFPVRFDLPLHFLRLQFDWKFLIIETFRLTNKALMLFLPIHEHCVQYLVSESLALQIDGFIQKVASPVLTEEETAQATEHAEKVAALVFNKSECFIESGSRVLFLPQAFLECPELRQFHRPKSWFWRKWSTLSVFDWNTRCFEQFVPEPSVLNSEFIAILRFTKKNILCQEGAEEPGNCVHSQLQSHK